MKPHSDTDLTIPSALAAEIQAIADEEHRTALDVLRDLVKRAQDERRQKAHIERVRQGRVVRKVSEMSAAELEAITSTEMDARHNHLDAELK